MTPLTPNSDSSQDTRQQRDIKSFEHAVDTISLGLLELDSLPLSDIGGSRLVDVTARLNAQYNSLEKLVSPLKDKLKVEGLIVGLDDNPEGVTLRGFRYKAVIRRVTKTILDTVKIKEYLGSALPRFQTSQNETRVIFQVKE